VYYKLATVIKFCFNKIRIYNNVTFQTDQNEPLQLRVLGL
jgi:hypothetical protein